MATDIERIRRIYDRAADRYDSLVLSEKLFFADGRIWVCSRASGDTLELAIGTGRNLPLYPPGIRLTGIDISSRLLSDPGWVWWNASRRGRGTMWSTRRMRMWLELDGQTMFEARS